MKQAIATLRKSLTRWADKDGELITAVPGLSFFRHDELPQTTFSIYEPSICLVVQGAKHVTLGEETYVTDMDHYLVTAVHLPTIVQIKDATQEKPFLGLRLTIDQQQVSHLMADSKLPLPQIQQSSRGMAAGILTVQLVTAMQRLIDLLDEQANIPILAPVIQREIVYRLLVGEQGMRLRQMAWVGSQSNQIAQAIHWLKENFSQPLKVDELARKNNMSKSTFHHHFRQLTDMSPLQYQKRLRLNEARRLMLLESMDVTRAAFEVGYESATQFTREYSRLFGAPPMRDVKNLRYDAAHNQVN